MARATSVDGVAGAQRLTALRHWIRVGLFWEALVVAVAFGVVLITLADQEVFGYVLVGLALVIALIWGIPFGRMTLAERVLRRVSFSRRNRNRESAGSMPADLEPLGEWVPGLTVNQTRSARGDDVGVITDGNSWTALLGLLSDDNLVGDAKDTIDLDALSGLTVQDDIVFAALQVITYTAPAPATMMLLPNTPAVESYRQIAGTQVPPSVRRTWIGVRLDPRLCLEAVASRGASNEGVYATLRFGLHRVQSALKRQGISTRELTAREIYAVLALTSGAIADQTTFDDGALRTTEGWNHWQCDDFFHCGRQISNWGESGSSGFQAVLDALNSAPIIFGVTSYTLDSSSRLAGGVRVAAPTAEQAERAMELLEEQLHGTVRFAPAGGDQVPALIGTVPLGREIE